MATNDSPKSRAIALLHQALDTGIKGRNRKAVLQAIDVLEDKGHDLTDMVYQHLKPGHELLDPNRPGFMMRANRGNKRWLYRYSWQGAQPELHLGNYPDISLADARDCWREARTIRLNGGDPKAVLAQRGQAGGDMMAFGRLEQRYLELAEKHKRSWRADMQLLARRIPNEWKDRPADSITKYDIGGVIQAAGVSQKDYATPTPREAEKLRTLLNAMFNLGMARGRRMRDWLASDSPVVEPWLTITANPVEATTLAKRDAATFHPEVKHLRAFLNNLGEIEHADIQQALLFQLYTNTRVSEACEATWDEIDLEADEWVIPGSRTKNGLAHRVMLPRQAVSLLQALGSQHGRAGQVFKSATGKALTNHTISHAISDNREKLGIPAGFVSHSLRHYGQTALAAMKCPVEVRDRVSNHKPPATMATHYNAHQYDQEAREWLQKVADHVQGLMTGNVVVLSEVK